MSSISHRKLTKRIERFMIQVLEEDIRPVLILTKADLEFNEKEIIDSLKHLSGKMPIYTTSIHSCKTIDLLRKSIKQGETAVFIGSSGVGKSSLINALCHKEILKTSFISDSTGVREFGITSNSNALSSILDISDLEESCRFKDCTHINEVGCAIIEAIENGTMKRPIYESYLKLRKEVSHFCSSEYEKRVRGKSFTKMIKSVKTLKKK